MKILKYTGIGLLFVIVLILIVALFTPNKVVYEKSISIYAPLEIVWENVNSLDDLDSWSPWNALDPDIKMEMKGTDGTVGAKLRWESDVDEVGAGTQTITKIEPPYYFQTALKFYDPYEREAISYIKLKEKSNNEVIATWGFKSEIPYPFNIMSLFSNMEDMMGEDWKKGLEKLKFLSEI